MKYWKGWQHWKMYGFAPIGLYYNNESIELLSRGGDKRLFILDAPVGMLVMI